MLTIMNPDDKAGLEAALAIKDQNEDVEVTVVTMGLPKAEEVLREAMAMGADKGVLVTDRVLGGADTWATSTTLAGALRNIDYDLIITGRQAIVVKRQYDDGYHMVKAQMPCLITALAELNEPRYMTPGGIFDAYDAEITTWGRADLKDVEDSNLGLNGSPTKIAKASDKVRKGAGEKVTPDSPEDAAKLIVDKLLSKHII